MESMIVIKVKYGEIIRRFTARILPGNDKLDIDIDELKAKIRSFFNFPLDADLKMTYIDEDGDIVTLLDDDDLYDVIGQRLNFLRIDVGLSRNSISPRSPWTRNCFLKLCRKISSKVALSSPVSLNLFRTGIQPSNSTRNSDSHPPIDLQSGYQSVEISEVNTRDITESSAYATDSDKSGCVDMEKETHKEKDNETTRYLPDDISWNDAVYSPISDMKLEYMNYCQYSSAYQMLGDLSTPLISENYIPSDKTNFGKSEEPSIVYRIGVMCDGCALLPIPGSHFKSKVKEGFYLCRMCFAKMGNEIDYIETNLPVFLWLFPHNQVDASRIKTSSTRLSDLNSFPRAIPVNNENNFPGLTTHKVPESSSAASNPVLGNKNHQVHTFPIPVTTPVGSTLPPLSGNYMSDKEIQSFLKELEAIKAKQVDLDEEVSMINNSDSILAALERMVNLKTNT